MSCETLPELFDETRKAESNHENEDQMAELRVTLLKLADSGSIKYSAKYIKKASEKTLKSIYKDYERQQLDQTNNELCDILITKFSELMEALEVVDGEKMEKELLDNGLLRNDLKSIVGRITPYIPMIGLLSGGVTVGKHVFLGTNKDVCPGPAHTSGNSGYNDSPDPSNG